MTARGAVAFIEEVFVKIQGKQQYLWRGVDQDGGVVDGFLQARRDGKAAKRLFRRLLNTHRGEDSLRVHWQSRCLQGFHRMGQRESTVSRQEFIGSMPLHALLSIATCRRVRASYAAQGLIELCRESAQ